MNSDEARVDRAAQLDERRIRKRVGSNETWLSSFESGRIEQQQLESCVVALTSMRGSVCVCACGVHGTCRVRHTVCKIVASHDAVGAKLGPVREDIFSAVAVIMSSVHVDEAKRKARRGARVRIETTTIDRIEFGARGLVFI